MRPVAVSQRVQRLPERGERRDALDQAMTSFLCAAGVLPLPVPNGLAGAAPDASILQAWLGACAPSAVVLTGGEDSGVHPERDETEALLLDYAEARELPVLGICRGLQVMAARAGAPLRPVEGHRGVRHAVAGVLSGEVNSFHALGLPAAPPGFDVLARSPDGLVEAVRARALPWEGWMWHPEREAVFAGRDVQRARALLGGVAR